MTYIPQITFLRFLAAFLVVIFHFGKTTWPFNNDSISRIISEGSIAVSFFFFLSGVVLTLNYFNKEKINVKAFYIKRFARIYPSYLTAFILSLVLGMLLSNSYPKGLSIILQALSLHAWSPGMCLEINFPAWSISVEVFFYLLFPFLIYGIKRLKPSTSTLIILLLWIASSIQHYFFSIELYNPNSNAMGEFILYFPLWNLNVFLMGILAGIYILKIKSSEKQNYKLARLFYVVGTVLFFVILGTENAIRPYTHNGLMAPVFFLIIAGIATDKSLVTRFLSLKPLRILGDSSYAIYIFQWPVFIVVSSVFGTKELNGSMFFTYSIILIVISILIYYFYETKTRKFILKKWLN